MYVNIKTFFAFLDGVWPNDHLEVSLLDWIELLPRELKIDGALSACRGRIPECSGCDWLVHLITFHFLVRLLVQEHSLLLDDVLGRE